MVKLNQKSYLGYMTIPIIMKKTYEGEGGVPADFFLHKYRKFPGFPAEIPEIS
jgi:hypothetical protein